MSDDERGHDPGTVFGPLRARPTPELDGEELWRRTAAELTPRPSRLPWWRRPWSSGGDPAGTAPAPVGALGAAALLLVLVVGGALYFDLPASLAPGGGDARRLVLLGSADGEGGADAESAAEGEADAEGEATGPTAREGTDEAPTGPLADREAPAADRPPPAGDAMAGVAPLSESLHLNVRLIRAYEGEPPAGVEPAGALGAGGADALADVRSQIQGLLAHSSYGLTGRWQGTAGEELQRGVELGPDARLQIVALTLARELGTVSVDVFGLRLQVDGEELTTPRLRLVPGRVYLLGLPEERPSRGTSRLLALRAELAETPRQP